MALSFSGLLVSVCYIAGCGGWWCWVGLPSTLEALEVGGGTLLIPPALWTEHTHQLSHSPTSNHGDLLL